MRGFREVYLFLDKSNLIEDIYLHL